MLLLLYERLMKSAREEIDACFARAYLAITCHVEVICLLAPAEAFRCRRGDGDTAGEADACFVGKI